MNALASFVNISEVDGLVKADETFFRFSKKGNRTKGRTYEKAPSTSKKRNLKKHLKNGGCLSNRSLLEQLLIDRVTG